MSAHPELTLQQMSAFHSLSRFVLGETDSAMAVLRGAAGTGKTFLTSRLVQCAIDAGFSVAIAARTNKAVAVLRTKMLEAGVSMPDTPLDNTLWRKSSDDDDQLAFGSIQALLGMRMQEHPDGSQTCIRKAASRLHRYDLVVVDECSMIGLDLFESIAYHKQNTRILFVGDPSQLPPIGNEQETSPAFTRVSLDISLTDIIRQQRDNPIVGLAHRIRLAIESCTRVSAQDIRDILPPVENAPPAAFVEGNEDTIVQYMLCELRDGRNARVVLYHDAAVQRMNHKIHTALYGDRTPYPFVNGQRVIVNYQCDATPLDDDTDSVKLITSEEAVVVGIAPETHPSYPSIKAMRVVLARENAPLVMVYCAYDDIALRKMISQCFAQYEALKSAAARARAASQHAQAREYDDQAREFSSHGWGLSRNFAPLRHAYAMTSHKSQGSTFDTVFLDFSDFAKVRQTFTFNRSLYVAITRPAKFLAIVSGTAH